MSDEILSIVYLLLVLILVFPSFIYANKNKKTFLKNFIIWFGIIAIILISIKFFSN
tara:strand:- start:238 stop:405 length:168 start_codon:yes stop_codon:yes gene_type:complete